MSDDHGLMDDNVQTAYIVQPVSKEQKSSRNVDDFIAEIEGLARAISLEVIQTRIAQYQKINAGAFLGKGTREAIAQEIEEVSPSIVIVNANLSPVQQRNLEKEWNAKVIDRTGLILEIFGARAQTKEGRLQVELAALEYQKSRLVRSWTHLERQRGGAGFMGGPGERQIELDRRIISQKITRLKKDLEDVRRTRNLARAGRERVPYPVVSFVGYTNAGKSTLFNQITKAGVFAKDLLFATLDPTMRKLTLPNNQEAIFADTVGFISDLPTHLVESFRATLEQITHADVIVHVIDVSRPDFEAQRRDVIKILDDLGIEYEMDARIIEAYNKIDALGEGIAYENIVSNAMREQGRCIGISALHGTGVPEFLNRVAAITARAHSLSIFSIPPSDGKAIAWLYANGEILAREDSDDAVILRVQIDEANANKFISRFSYHPLIGS